MFKNHVQWEIFDIWRTAKKASSVIINKQNLRFLAIEMFSVIKDISPLRVNEPFDLNEGVTAIW